MPDQVIVHEGMLQPTLEKTYVHLPFDVPPHATRIQVEYKYSDKIGSSPLLTGGNTLDLGVFDARGIDFLSAGFRGWSGSERSSFFITEARATPGYLAGPLTPGRWHVLLGLYKIAPAGCKYRVEIALSTGDRPSTDDRRRSMVGGDNSRDLPSSAPNVPFAPWLRGELHCHSWHSDGDRSPDDVVKLARERGLDFLAISDHNTIASQCDLANLKEPGLILIRGTEATTFKGHFCVWGIPDWIDFRVQTPEQMAGALRFAAERGALTSCNHPKPLGPPWDYNSVTNFDCVEVWNGPWTRLDQTALDYWVSLLATGRRVSCVGGSDWHRQVHLETVPQRAPGTPTTWVYVEGKPNAGAILNAIRRGRVGLSDEPNGAFVDLRASEAMAGDVITHPADGSLSVQVRCQRGAGNILRLLDQRGMQFEQLIVGLDESIDTKLDVSSSLYLRAELRSPNGAAKSITNPIYLGQSLKLAHGLSKIVNEPSCA
jgi:PHP domain-containing protein